MESTGKPHNILVTDIGGTNARMILKRISFVTLSRSTYPR